MGLLNGIRFSYLAKVKEKLPFVSRSICWQMLFKIDVLKNSTNFTGKRLCWCLILFKFAKNRLQRTYFPVKVAKFSRRPFFSQNTSSGCFCLYQVDACFVNQIDICTFFAHWHFPVNFTKFLKRSLTTSGGCFFLSQDANHQSTL